LLARHQAADDVLRGSRGGRADRLRERTT
jgi:hypothetical protein